MDRNRLQKRLTVLLRMGFSIGCLFGVAIAFAEPHHFVVPAGQAAQTLPVFADQVDVFLSYDLDVVQHQHTRAIEGDFEIKDALFRMLEGSGLHFEVSKTGSVFVYLDEHVSHEPVAPRAASGPAKEEARLPDKRLETVYVRYTPDEASDVAVRGTVPTDTSVESVTLDADVIEKSGAHSVPDLLGPLVYNFGGGVTEDTQSLARESPTNVDSPSRIT